MNISAASLHIALPPLRSGLRLGALSGPADPVNAIEKAYAGLGWRRVADGAAATRRIVLVRSEGASFISIHDAACQGADNDLLAELAVRLSRALRTSAIVTTFPDAETFGFVLFHRGEQVDSVSTNSGDPPWRTVRGRPQAELWRANFGRAHFAGLQDAGANKLEDPLAAFMARAGAAAAIPASSAATALAAWCSLAGLPVRSLAPDGEHGNAQHLHFAAAPDIGGAARRRVLRFDASLADCAYHSFYPAAWPVAASGEQSFSWPLLCRGGGMRGFRLALHIDRTSAFVLRKISLTAYGVQAGRMNAAAPLAHFGQTVPEAAGAVEADFVFDSDHFGLNDAALPGRGTYALLIRAEFATPAAGDATVTPTLRAGGADGKLLILPTLRLAVTQVRWAPVVADPLDENPLRREAVLRLNAPALHTCVALLADTGEDVRIALRDAVEQFLAPVTSTALMARVHTEKHIQQGLAVARAAQVLPVRTLLQDKIWPRLFDAANAYQTVQIGISLPDAASPLAGVSLAASLQDQHEDTTDALRFGGPSLAVAFWTNADDSALSLVKIDYPSAQSGFSAFVRNAAPLQAWCADCAWIPVFDRYGAYTLTPYEAAADIDWFGRGLAGTLTDRAWLRRRLRFVAPRMWLGWQMAELIDATTLTSFAQVMEIEDGLEIVLYNPADLARLEKALLAILPINL